VEDDDAAAQGYVARTAGARTARRPTVALGAVQGTRSAAMKSKEQTFLRQISGGGGGDKDGDSDEAAAAAVPSPAKGRPAPARRKVQADGE
jgi:hypothetical protein